MFRTFSGERIFSNKFLLGEIDAYSEIGAGVFDEFIPPHYCFGGITVTVHKILGLR